MNFAFITMILNRTTKFSMENGADATSEKKGRVGHSADKVMMIIFDFLYQHAVPQDQTVIVDYYKSILITVLRHFK